MMQQSLNPLALDWRATLRAETADEADEVLGLDGVTCVHELDIEFMCAPLVALDVARETAERIGFARRAEYHVTRLVRA